MDRVSSVRPPRSRPYCVNTHISFRDLLFQSRLVAFQYILKAPNYQPTGPVLTCNSLPFITYREIRTTLCRTFARLLYSVGVYLPTGYEISRTLPSLPLLCSGEYYHVFSSTGCAIEAPKRLKHGAIRGRIGNRRETGIGSIEAKWDRNNKFTRPSTTVLYTSAKTCSLARRRLNIWRTRPIDRPDARRP